MRPCWHCLPLLLTSVQALVTTTYYANTTTERETLRSPSSAPDSSTNVGAYIAQGLGGSQSDSSDTQQSTSIPAPSSQSSLTLTSSATVQHNTTSTYLAPITTFSSTALSASFSYASNVSGITEAAQCWSDLSSWYVSSVSWYNSFAANSTFAVTNTSQPNFDPIDKTTTFYPTNVSSTYTLCDGSPRADVSPLTQYITSISTYYYTYQQPDLPSSFRSQPCTPTPEQCRIYYYNSNLYDPSADASVWESFNNETRMENDEDRADADQLLRYCGFPAHLSEPCIIAGGPVQLFYFAVDTIGGDLCYPNGSNISTIINTKPEVVTTLGREYTSGSVYLSFSTLYASYDGFWDRIGPTYSDYVMTLKTEDVSTHCGGGAIGWDWGPATQVNFADWNKPLRADVYNCQKQCSSTAPCSTIWDNFNPWLAVPTVIKSMVPQWSTCTYNDDMEAPLLFDPPKALQQVATAASITMPSSPSPTPASPSSTFISPLPVETGPRSSTQKSTTSAVDSPGLPSSYPSDIPGSSSSTPPAAGFSESPVVQSSMVDPQSAGESTQISYNPTPGDTSDTQQTSTGESWDPANTQGVPFAPSADPGGAIASVFDSVAPTVANETPSASPGNVIAAASDSWMAATTAVKESGTPNALTVLHSALNSAVDPNTSPANDDGHSESNGSLGDGLATSVGASSQGINIAGSSQEWQNAAATTLTIDNKIFTVSQAPNSDLLVNGMIVSQGVTATQVDGQMFSIESSHLFAGSTTVELPSLPTPVGAITVGVEIAGTTLSVGGPELCTNGRTISLASNGLVLVGAQTTERFSSMPTDLPNGSSVLVAGAITLTAAAISGMDTAIAGARYTVGSQVFSVDDDASAPGVEIVDGSISITVGGSAQTVDGHAFSAASDAVVVVDGSSVRLSATVTSEGNARQTVDPTTTRPADVAVIQASTSPSGSASSDASPLCLGRLQAVLAIVFSVSWII
ncbi:hypothetical protein LTR56_004676 [Elasticomyces elasticus]|nr:hypothetical protein LTR56_004676 [Elasticomyces elasticus]KAK3665530.1 hypothetical protein LTR22_003470 [Elasticomyces elasticus]KAK4930433.1 hypothetical protein LTR49_003174 [Elasticomyces elasticus]KAK5768842.1 hypothetical protein LTS12_000902 [Elasticomyces elasticus]